MEKIKDIFERILKSIIRAIFYYPKFIKMFARLLIDKRVPWFAKALPMLAIIYAISPIDLVPQFLLPILGGLDDLIILYFGFRGLVALTPHEIIEEHLKRIEHGL